MLLVLILPLFCCSNVKTSEYYITYDFIIFNFFIFFSSWIVQSKTLGRCVVASHIIGRAVASSHPAVTTTPGLLLMTDDIAED
jgi:hypothetical protein